MDGWDWRDPWAETAATNPSYCWNTLQIDRPLIQQLNQSDQTTAHFPTDPKNECTTHRTHTKRSFQQTSKSLLLKSCRIYKNRLIISRYLPITPLASSPHVQRSQHIIIHAVLRSQLRGRAHLHVVHDVQREESDSDVGVDVRVQPSR